MAEFQEAARLQSQRSVTVGVHGGTVDLTAAIATAVAQLETSKR